MEKNVIKAILACDEKGGIGKNGSLPWPHNSADLKWFKENTAGCSVVMGRNTWESLPVKPLPNRENVVVTSRSLSEEHEDLIVGDIKSVLKVLPMMKKDDQDVWIIGGAQLIERMIPYIEEFYLSRIDGDYDCDTFLPLTKIQEVFKIKDITITPDMKFEVYKRK